MSLVARKVWMRGALGVAHGLAGGGDVALVGAGEPGHDHARRPPAPPPGSASKSPGEAIGKPASMMSTPSRASCCADLDLLARVQRAARRLLAVAERGVEDR